MKNSELTNAINSKVAETRYSAENAYKASIESIFVEKKHKEKVSRLKMTEKPLAYRFSKFTKTAEERIIAFKNNIIELRELVLSEKMVDNENYLNDLSNLEKRTNHLKIQLASLELNSIENLSNYKTEFNFEMETLGNDVIDLIIYHRN